MSLDNKINPDLAFFSLLLKENSEIIAVAVIVLAISLTAVSYTHLTLPTNREV